MQTLAIPSQDIQNMVLVLPSSKLKFYSSELDSEVIRLFCISKLICGSIQNNFTVNLLHVCVVLPPVMDSQTVTIPAKNHEQCCLLLCILKETLDLKSVSQNLQGNASPSKCISTCSLMLDIRVKDFSQ